MSVAIFTDNDFDKVNGVTTTLTALLRNVPPDLRVRIYTASAIGVDVPDYLAVKSAGLPIPFYAGMQMYLPRPRAFRRHLAADAVRVLHLTTPGPIWLAARYLASHEGMRLVGSFHTNLAEYTALLSGSARLGTVMGAYLRWLYGRCEPILVPSQDTRQRLLDRGWTAARMSVWTRGVDTATFAPARRSTVLRERWRVCDRRPALIYVGRVSREKGLALLEPLCSLLHQYRVAHRLIVVGEAPMLGELKDRLPDAVFTRRLGHDQVAVAMASADLMVFPSETDTAGNVVLEAQASGLPVLVTDAGGPRENIRDGVTGHACRAGDAEGFCRHAAELLSDRARCDAMGRAARAFAQDRSWPASLSPLFGVYRSALAGAVPDAPAMPVAVDGANAASQV